VMAEHLAHAILQRRDPAEPKYDAETTRLIRLHLERVARQLERRVGSYPYMQAWKLAARIVRDSKPD
jgi:hypothetical protein